MERDGGWWRPVDTKFSSIRRARASDETTRVLVIKTHFTEIGGRWTKKDRGRTKGVHFDCDAEGAGEKKMSGTRDFR